jgi:hypothetical protein
MFGTGKNPFLPFMFDPLQEIPRCGEFVVEHSRIPLLPGSPTNKRDAILALRISGWSPVKGMPILEHRREFGPKESIK